jgi:zinc protease
MGTFSKQVITNDEVKGVKTYVMPTGAKDVVTISGSMLGGSIHCTSTNSKTAALVTSMLDKGTEKKDKYEISETLESVGAELSFSSTRYHTHFTGFCLKNNLDTVVSLLSEQLMTPSFSSSELSTLQSRICGNLERDKENTKKLAMIHFLRTLFPSNHPNYRETVEESIDLVNKITKEDLFAFHKQQYGLGSIKIAATGDLNPEDFNGRMLEAIRGWNNKKIEIPKLVKKAREPKEGNETIMVQDKTSADLYIGQSIGIDREHEDYYALMLGVYILGGNFSARLMQTVRDKQGLTYGIGSSISGVSFGADGYWSIWGTFAPDIIKKGIVATKEQVDLWFKKGVTEEELSAKKTTISGSYKVSMDSTAGLAAKILSNAEQGRTLSYLDDYPKIIESVSLSDVNMAIQKYVNPNKLYMVSAGTL